MRGLKDIVDGSRARAKAHNAVHHFIQPDNSFGTWWNLIDPTGKYEHTHAEIHKIKALPENRLHLSPEDVTQFYRNYAPHQFESWYITPVGNPSGTAMTQTQLTDTCQTIINHNPDAFIILDTVYARTLSTDDAKTLFHGVVTNPTLLNRVLFLESFSKSHGLCRERLGCYFSTNSALFGALHAAAITFSAGSGHSKDFQFQALGEASAEDNLGVRDLHLFWQKERQGLYNHLVGKYPHLWAPVQTHLTPEDLNRTLGLYLLLKTAPGITAQEIFLETGILGVDTKLLSGHYIRFAVGMMNQPKYSDVK